MDVGHFLHDWGPWIGGTLVAVPPWLKGWIEVRSAKHAVEAADSKQRIDLLDLARQAAGEVIEDLRGENARIRDQMAKIEREFGEFRRMHDGMIADKDAELALLRGELRQWKALALSYHQKLETAQIPHELPRQPWFGVEAGSAPVELAPNMPALGARP